MHWFQYGSGSSILAQCGSGYRLYHRPQVLKSLLSSFYISSFFILFYRYCCLGTGTSTAPPVTVLPSKKWPSQNDSKIIQAKEKGFFHLSQFCCGWIRVRIQERQINADPWLYRYATKLHWKIRGSSAYSHSVRVGTYIVRLHVLSANFFSEPVQSWCIEIGTVGTFFGSDTRLSTHSCELWP